MSERQSTETADEMEARLQHDRESHRERRSTATADETEARLQHDRESHRERRSTETADETDARLQHDRESHRERRSTETADETEARLQHDRESHRERRSTETADETEARLQHDRESHREQRALGALSQSQLPLIQQRSVQAKMKKFHTHLATLEVSRCSTCLEAFPGLHPQPGSTECARCGRDKHTPKLYSSGNNVDPGPIPAQLQVIIKLFTYICMYQLLNICTVTCIINSAKIHPLQGLTQVEEMLISAVLPIMSLYRLPHGQYGYSGHVINLPQDIASFATSLPRLPSKLDVIVVRKEGATQSHRDFRVRRSVVLRALQWLLANNVYYRNIRIDPNALALLPEDGDLTGLRSVTVENDDQETPPAQNDAHDAHIATSFVPNNLNPRMTEQETIRKSVEERQSLQPAETPPVVMWPPSGGTPINEFKTEGYMSCAFPTLFPTGACR